MSDVSGRSEPDPDVQLLRPPSAKEGIRGPEEDDDRWSSHSLNRTRNRLGVLRPVFSFLGGAEEEDPNDCQ